MRPIDERVEQYKLAMALYMKAVAVGDLTAVKPIPKDHGVDDWLAQQLDAQLTQELNVEPFPTQKVPIREQIECAEKELRRRQDVCPKLIKTGRLNQYEADKAIARMSAILETLRQVKERSKF